LLRFIFSRPVLEHRNSCSRTGLEEVLSKKMKKRLHVYYEGSVQGVGFRFTVERIASELNIVGWVKNLPDGKVELIAEGQENNLSELLTQIKDNTPGYISRDIIDWQGYKGEFKDFVIRF